MISETDLAALLVAHHGADPESADLLAGLVADGIQEAASRGQPRTLADAITAAKQGYEPLFLKHIPAPTPVPVPSSASDRPMNTTERIAAEHCAAASTITSPTSSNPWSATGWSVTAQVAMQHRDPDRAAKLKLEAGK